MAVIKEPDGTIAQTTQRPMHLAALGSYSLALDNGTTVFTAGAQTAAEFLQFRWTDATRVCVIRSIRVSLGAVVAFVAGKLVVTGTTARAFTVVGSGTGSANPTITGDNNKKRTSMGSTLLTAANIVMAGTGFLGAGTKTLDSQPFANISTAAPTTVGPILTNAVLWNRDDSSEWPLILAANEGIILRLTAPGTGTYYLGVTIEWDELLPASSTTL